MDLWTMYCMLRLPLLRPGSFGNEGSLLNINRASLSLGPLVSSAKLFSILFFLYGMLFFSLL